MEARIVSTLEDVGLDERQWNDLVRQSDTNTVFQTYEWSRSWLAAFGDQYEACFVTALDGSEVKGVAPVVIAREGSRDRVVRFLGDGRADYCDFLASGDKDRAAATMADALLGQHSWDVIELNNLPGDSRTIAMLRESCGRAGYHVMTDKQFLCPTLLIAGHEQTAQRIRNKPSLRRRESRCRRNGALVCRHLRAMAEVEPYLERFFAQHVERWADSGSPSLFLNTRSCSFYRILAASLGEKGWLLFSVVELEGRPIAFHYGFDYEGAVVWYKPSFDAAHACLSPGLVLVRQLIAYAVDHGRRELDFTVGAEPFKARFTNAFRTTVRARVFRSPIRFALARSRRFLMRAVRRDPARRWRGHRRLTGTCERPEDGRGL